MTGGKRDAATNRRVGGASHSYHLTDRAGDFHVRGMTDNQVDQALKDPHSPLATLGMNVIQHGPYTKTGGAHVHIDSRNQPGAQTTFQHEGMTPETKGRYTYDAPPAPVGVRNQAQRPAAARRARRRRRP